jgi:hypothetical protein
MPQGSREATDRCRRQRRSHCQEAGRGRAQREHSPQEAIDRSRRIGSVPGGYAEFGPSPADHATLRYASFRATCGMHPKNRMRRLQGVSSKGQAHRPLLIVLETRRWRSRRAQGYKAGFGQL